jgi:hypothetical protein
MMHQLQKLLPRLCWDQRTQHPRHSLVDVVVRFFLHSRSLWTHTWFGRAPQTGWCLGSRRETPPPPASPPLAHVGAARACWPPAPQALGDWVRQTPWHGAGARRVGTCRMRRGCCPCVPEQAPPPPLHLRRADVAAGCARDSHWNIGASYVPRSSSRDGHSHTCAQVPAGDALRRQARHLCRKVRLEVRAGLGERERHAAQAALRELLRGAVEGGPHAAHTGRGEGWVWVWGCGGEVR